MYELKVYYYGPYDQKLSFFESLFGTEPRVCYDLNPQLYKNDSSSSLRNLGVIKVDFSSPAPSGEGLENFLREKILEGLGVGIPVGKSIIPSEKIAITFEEHSE